MQRSPAQPPATPSQGPPSHPSRSPTPLGLPLTRSPTPLRRLRSPADGAAIDVASQRSGLPDAASLASMYAHPWASLARGGSGAGTPSEATTPIALTTSVQPSVCVLHPPPSDAASAQAGSGTEPPALSPASAGAASTSASSAVTAQSGSPTSRAPDDRAGGSRCQSPLGPRSLIAPDAPNRGGGCAPGTHAFPLSTTPADGSADDAAARRRASAAGSAPASRRLSSTADGTTLAEAPTGAVVAPAPATQGPFSSALVSKESTEALPDAAQPAAAAGRSMIGSTRPRSAAPPTAPPEAPAALAQPPSTDAPPAQGAGSSASATPARPLSPVLPPVSLQRVRTGTQSSHGDATSRSQSAAGDTDPSARRSVSLRSMAPHDAASESVSAAHAAPHQVAQHQDACTSTSASAAPDASAAPTQPAPPHAAVAAQERPRSSHSAAVAQPRASGIAPPLAAEYGSMDLWAGTSPLTRASRDSTFHPARVPHLADGTCADRAATTCLHQRRPQEVDVETVPEEEAGCGEDGAAPEEVVASATTATASPGSKPGSKFDRAPRDLVGWC